MSNEGKGDRDLRKFRTSLNNSINFLSSAGIYEKGEFKLIKSIYKL